MTGCGAVGVVIDVRHREGAVSQGPLLDVHGSGLSCTMKEIRYGLRRCIDGVWWRRQRKGPKLLGMRRKGVNGLGIDQTGGSARIEMVVGRGEKVRCEHLSDSRFLEPFSNSCS